MDRAETEKRERQKREKKCRRERRERGDRERREPDIYYISETDEQAKNGNKISKKKLHIVGRKGKMNCHNKTLRLMRVKLLQIRKGSWKGKLIYCESMVEG